ncbi:MAG TPA: hypothetical protein VMM78_16235 [Thermomicrobiales bacterium]|nr:hypothetical protein [Thermomicrobiales bacterium]
MAHETSDSVELDPESLIQGDSDILRAADNERAIQILESILAQEPGEQRCQWDCFEREIDADRVIQHRLFR